MKHRTGSLELGGGMKALTVILLLLGIAAAGTYVAQQYGFFSTVKSVGGTGNTGAGPGGCANNYVPPSGFQCANLQAQYFVFDPLVAAGTANGISGAQVSLSDPVTLSSKDVPSTTASTGLVTGGAYLISGQSWLGKVSTTNYVTEYPPIFVPPISNSAQQVTTIQIPIPEIKTGSWSWSASGGGTTWSSSFSSYGFSAAGTTSVTMSFTVTENTNNEGYYSGYDSFNKLQNLAVWDFKSPSSPTTSMTGCQFSVTRNNVAYCQFIMPDGFTSISPNYSQGSTAVGGGVPQPSASGRITGNFPQTSDGRYTSAAPASQIITANGATTTGSLSQQYVGTSVVAGSTTFSVTFNKGSLTSSETWTMGLHLGADVSYFDGGNGYGQNGGYGTDASTATLTGGNAPTVILNA